MIAEGFKLHQNFTKTPPPFHRRITRESPTAQSSSSCRGVPPFLILCSLLLRSWLISLLILVLGLNKPEKILPKAVKILVKPFRTVHKSSVKPFRALRKSSVTSHKSSVKPFRTLHKSSVTSSPMLVKPFQMFQLIQILIRLSTRSKLLPISN